MFQGFFFLYAICASAVIFTSLFAVTVFVGVLVFDIWKSTSYSQVTKAMFILAAVLFPEVGVMSWALYFERGRKFFFRLLAFGTSGVYLLLQLAWLFSPALVQDFGVGWSDGFVAHVIWLPIVWVGGAVSFFIMRALQAKNPSNEISSHIQEEAP